jgi:hypothetical protein
LLFRVLGPVQVDGADLQPGSQERLLAVLLQRANSWVDADTVVRAIWPEDPPASAKGSVKAQIYQLRRVLPRAVDGSPRINSRSGGFRLNLERTELDAALFEELIKQGQSALEHGNWTTAISRLTQALELWRGEPYGPLGREVAPGETARLQDLRDEALDSYQEACEAKSRRAEPVAAEPAEPDAEQTQVLRLGPPPDVRRPVPDQDSEPWTHWRVEQSSGRSKRRIGVALAAAVVALAVAVTVVVLSFDGDSVLGAGRASSQASTTAGPQTTANASQQGVAPRRSVPGLPPRGERKLLFGVGGELDTVADSELVRSTPTRMLTTWYRGRDDLQKLLAWKDTVVKQAYQDGFALHLILGSAEQPGQLDTAHGPACGRRSVLQPDYREDVSQLIRAFAGTAQSPPLFVTVFHDAQSYSCNQDGFAPDPATRAYFLALKDQYVLIRQIVHRAAPNALASLGLDAGLAGAESNQDTGAGMAMLPNFHEVLSWSDFYSVSVTDGSGDSADDVTAMVGALGRYGPVMLSWYEPAGSPTGVVDADLRALLDEGKLGELSQAGLFALSFGPGALDAAPENFLTDAIRRFGRPAF